MVQKFTKKELVRLGCNDEEITLIMKYQSKLPMPDVDFEINARTLHLYLNVKRDNSTWIKGRIQKYQFTENKDYKISYESDVPKNGDVDFSMLSAAERSRQGVRTEYYLTINMCKELCTIENNKLGRLARQYFILMEDILLRNKQWLEIRNPEKLEYKNMCKEINAWIFRIWHKNAANCDYAVEANEINKIVTGKTSQELKVQYKCPVNEMIRDYLKKDHNEELLFLEKQNQLLLRMDMGFTERMNMLSKMHEVTFKEKRSIA